LPEEGELEHTEEAAGELLVVRADATVLLDVADAAFDDVAASVHEPDEAASSLAFDLIRPLWDHIEDAETLAPPADTRGAVALVPGDPDRLASLRPHAGNRILEVLGLVGLACRDGHADGDAEPTTNQMDLGPESAS